MPLKHTLLFLRHQSIHLKITLISSIRARFNTWLGLIPTLSLQTSRNSGISLCTEEAQSCFYFLSTLDRLFNSSTISIIQLLRYVFAIWISIFLLFLAHYALGSLPGLGQLQHCVYLHTETVELVCVLKKRRAVLFSFNIG